MTWAQRRSMLLGSTVCYAPPGEGGAGGADDADPPADDDDPEAELDADPALGEDDTDPPAEDDVDPPADDDTEPPAEDEPPQQSRAERRIAAQQTRLRDAEERAIRAEARLAEREAIQRPQQVQETAEAEAQRLALMTPEEQVVYKVDKALRASDQRNNAIVFQMQDTADKAAYDAKAVNDKRYAKYSDAVEKKLTEVRSKGQNIQREALLYYVIGERVVKGGPSAAKPQKRAAAGRVERQQVRGSERRSDASGDRGSRGSSAAKRLEGVRI